GVEGLCVVIGLALASAVYSQQSQPIADGKITVEPLASPAGPNTTEPQFTTDGTRTILSWLELAGTHSALKFAERTASGWSEVHVAAEGSDFMRNASDVPSVRVLADGTLVAQWLQEDG